MRKPLFVGFFLFLVSLTYSQIQIGYGSITDKHLPIEPYYNYSYTQSIYLQSEIRASDSIKGIQYYFTGSSLNKSDSITIYIGHTTKDSFNTTTDWISTSGLTQVFKGKIVNPSAPGWVQIIFNTPFLYNNINNLVIAIEEDRPQFNDDLDDFYSTLTPSARSIVYYDDSNNPDPLFPPTAKSIQHYIPNIIFDSIVQSCPDVTNISFFQIGTDSVNLTWNAGLYDSMWLIEYDTAGFTLGTGYTLASTNDSTTLYSLQQNTIYDVYVRGICPLGDTGYWIGPLTFITLKTCPEPTLPYPFNTTVNSTNFSWTPGGNDTAWQINYAVSGNPIDSGIFLYTINNTTTINGLQSGTTYDAYVRGICGLGDTSIWVGPTTFTTQCTFYNAPWIEEFPDNTPNCFTQTGDHPWEFGSQNGTIPPGFAAYGAENVTDYSTSGTGTFIGMDGSDNINNHNSHLETPLVNLSPLTNPSLSFAVFSNNINDAAKNRLIIQFYDGITWHSLDTVQQNLGVNWVWKEYDLRPFTISGNVKAKFSVLGVSNGGSTFYNDILLDNIAFNEFNTCPDPDSILVLNIGRDSIQFKFKPGKFDSTWIVQYDTTGFLLDSGLFLFTNNDTISITGLGPDTTYDIYLRSICSLGDSSDWIGPLTVTTLAICPVPSNIRDFNIARDSNNITWTQGISDSIWEIQYDTAGFTLGLGKDTLLINDTLALLGLTPSTSYDVYLRSICTVSDTSKWIGPFTFTTLESCPQIVSINDYYTTDDSTNIIVTTGPYDSVWQLEYGYSGFTPGTGITLNSTNDTISLNGLTSSSNYHVYVRSICTGGDTSIWVGPYAFSTLCVVYKAAHLETFASFLPFCWEQATGMLTPSSVLISGGSDWGQGLFGNIGSNMSAALNLSLNNQKEWLISPTIDLGDGSNPYVLEFDVALTSWATAYSSTFDADDKLVVLISTDNGITWSNSNSLITFNSTTPISNTGDHYLYDLDANGYTGLVKFAFYAESTIASSDNDVFIDNVAVNPSPVCLPVTQVGYFNAGTDSAFVFWTGKPSTDSIYVIEYGVEGFLLGTGTVVNTSNDTVLLTGLSPNLTYDFYVSSWCTLTDTSSVNGPNKLNTDLTNPSLCGLNRIVKDNACSSQNVFDVEVTSAPGIMLGIDVIVEKVNLIINHPFVSDLEVRLVSPNGDTVDLSIQNGGSTQNYGDTTGGCTQYTSFTMDAVDSIQNSSAPFIGEFLPEEDLAQFNSATSPIGTWKLIVCDKFSSDIGFLQYIEIVLSFPPTCPKPRGLSSFSPGTDSINLTWTPGINDSIWIVEFGPQGFTPGSGTFINSTNDTLTIFGLITDAVYDFYVRSICQIGDSSIWVGPITDSTQPLCLKIQGFSAVNSDSTSILVGWNVDASQQTFILEYGLAGFPQGSGTTITVNAPANFYSVIGLAPQTTYDFFVRAVCNSGDSSLWLGPYQGTTKCTNQRIPWFEGFENNPLYGVAKMPECWVEDGDWGTDTVANNYNRKPRTGLGYLYTNWSANDWVFTPYFYLSDTGVYEFSYWNASDSLFGWDSVRVAVGPFQSRTSMSTILNVDNTLLHQTYRQTKLYYTPSTSGIYCFGVQVRGQSFPNNYIVFDDFNLRDTTNFIGITELAKAKQLKVYPNPNNGSFSIQNIGDNIHGSLTITDIQGRELMKEVIYLNEGGIKQIILHNAEKGLYIVTIYRDGVFEQHRIIVQ